MVLLQIYWRRGSKDSSVWFLMFSSVLSLLETIVKTKGFHAGEPQAGMTHFSKGLPGTRYLRTVWGDASVNGIVVHMDDLSNLFFDIGESIPQAQPVFPGRFGNGIAQTADPAPLEKPSIDFFCGTEAIVSDKKFGLQEKKRSFYRVE